jgi:tetratricopeptide (TPR) repeat protein
MDDAFRSLDKARETCDRLLRRAPDCAFVAALRDRCRRLASVQPEEIASWNFSSDAEGWKAAHNCRLAVSGGILRVDITGADPYMFTGVTAPAGRLRTTIRVRSSEPGWFQLYWTTSAHPFPAQENSLTSLLIPAGPCWREWIFSFSVGAPLQSLRVDPESTGSRVEIDSIKLQAGAEMIDLLTQAIELKPEDPRVWENRGKVFAEHGQSEEGAADIAKALTLLPQEQIRWWDFPPRTADAPAPWDKVFDQLLKIQPKGSRLSAAVFSDHAWHGRWNEAAAAANALLEFKPEALTASDLDSFHFRLAYACLRLLTDDPEGYRRLCLSQVDRFAQREDAPLLMLVGRICVLAPDAGCDPARSIQIAKRAQAGKLPDYVFWPGAALYVLGTAHYRAGEFERAVRCCRESIEKYPTWPGNFLNWPVLAMASQRLGRSEEARSWLGKTEEWASQVTRGTSRKPATSHSRLNIENWLEVQVLLREARLLILDQGFPSDPFAE